MHDETEETGDRLFLIAESQANDFSLFAERESSSLADHVAGLLDEAEIGRELQLLRELDTDAYCERCVAPAEDPGRAGAQVVIKKLVNKVVSEVESGSLYAATATMRWGGRDRTVGFLAQNRAVRNGVWGPDEHLEASRVVEGWSRARLPIVTLIDTPGADAGEEANRNNQAHSISRLIAKMCNLDVPTVGIILGLGYSGGAIPLAASNLVLSVRDGVFNTIQPKGLASIARKYQLSWQECAKLVGVSAFELCRQGNIDGIIDYTPAQADRNVDKLRLAIETGIDHVESVARDFVADSPYIVDHYRRSLSRYLNPSERLEKVQNMAALSSSDRTPTEFSNVFGVAFRYLRYLGLRKRIHSTTTKQYGRLAEAEVPEGDLASRAEYDRRLAFLSWLQDPEKIVYDDALAKAWKNYQEKLGAVDDERGRIAQLIFGEPKKNFEQARAALLTAVTGYLYNRWKGQANGNLVALIEHLRYPDATRLLLSSDDIRMPATLVRQLRDDESALSTFLRDKLSSAGRRLLAPNVETEKSESFLRDNLAAELNLVFAQHDVAVELAAGDIGRSAEPGSASALNDARRLLVEAYPDLVRAASTGDAAPAAGDATVLDVLLDPDLREDFASECADLLIFDGLYDQLILNLDTIAEEANASRVISQSSLGALLDRCLEKAGQSLALSLQSGDEELPGEAVDVLRKKIFEWLAGIDEHGRRSDFLKAVEEWKKSIFPHISDTLFVVVTVMLERLIPSYAQAMDSGRKYDGRVNPRNIGRRKDFWNRLTIAYRDLQIQNVLEAVKRTRSTTSSAIVDRYFDHFETLYDDVITGDPARFPGFRVSIEQALARDVIPCGIIAGIGDFKGPNGPIRAGAVISNVDFQAGAFDMASAEKFCHLLVDCARQRLPLICFISSGGMQTKEGAGSLYSMAAVNARITRFVRDLDLPVIVFGFGDCTGGAQASFVTHPLAQTFYFSGTNMPFAGQIVVPSNLSSQATLSNYLSVAPGAMQGLVRHPFSPDIDESLRRIDPAIPLPTEDVEEVVARVVAGVISESQPAAAPEELGPADTGNLVRPIRRTLIHARGCTAAKLIRIAQQEGVEVVLVQSDPDMDSVAVDMLRDSDRLVCIGGNTSDESYLNGQSVVRVAEHEQVDSLHPGIGFLSENSHFAELCRTHGINFIGPPVAAMEAMGNKSNAIKTARSLDVPVVPGSHGILTDVERAAEVALEIGYPVLIKAVHGGGGKGIQVVEDPADFHDLFLQVTAEARSAFGNGDVYLEKFVTSLRHIEAQLLRDTHGNTRVIGLRDCSVQRNKQKIVEESSSTELPAELEQQVYRHTAAIADEVGYVGAGTVEYIYDRANNAVYFMEMNTRLQVEHPVTEKVSGIDIVATQFRIASGGSIAELEPASNGYAIEVRINAEKPVVDSRGGLSVRPDPGEIKACEFPARDDIDVIPAIATGKTVSPFYDSLVAQVIVHGDDRNDAARRMVDYLGHVRIEGVCTNIALLKRILTDEVFLNGEYDTSYLEGFVERTDLDALVEEIERDAQVESVSLDLDAIRIEGSDELKVLSPSTGIFYLTPSPSEPEYVSVGGEIGVDQTLCQLEAMKLFTPLKLDSFNNADSSLFPGDKRYVVTRINVSHAQQVNAGDLLFVVRPTAAAA